MPIVYVCSTEPALGKTALATGLGLALRELGLPVRYARLGAAGHPDHVRTAAILGHAPLAIAADATLGDPPLDAGPEDVLLVEGPSDRAVQARRNDLVLLVAAYRGRYTLERIAATGVEPDALVLNAVPSMYAERVQEQVLPALAARGWQTLGAVPHQQLMLGVPVRALAERLGGRWLCGEAHGDRLVARLAIAGGMLQDALLWLARRPHNALICKGDRADLPLAALQAGTVAIFLTERLQPGPQVLAGARDRGIPVIVVHQHAIRVLETVENMFTAPPVHHPQKADTAQALVERHLDLDALCRRLGLVQRAGGRGSAVRGTVESSGVIRDAR